MKPLEGIKVVELADYVAIPAATRLLGDWGATVFKVEHPKGDPTRQLGPSFKMIDFNEVDYNHVFDMFGGGNKEYVCLDLKKPAGMAALHRLLENADVFATNWRQKALDKIGLDYDTLKVKYPGLVYARVDGYGSAGPEKDSPGYDAISYAARGGWMRSLPQLGDAPINWPNAMGDIPTSTTVTGGICAALVKRAKTGKGDYVCSSLYHVALYFMTCGLVTTTYGNRYPGSRKNPPSPLNNTYPTRDGGWIFLCMPVYNAEFNRCMDLIGRQDLIDSPVYGDYNKVRAENRVSEMVDIVEAGFMTKDVDTWARIFKEKDIPGGKCFTYEDILQDPQAWENNFLRKIQYTDEVAGVVTDTPVRIESVGLPTLRKSRPVGTDTKAVLSQFGYTEEELAAMSAEGSIVMR